jgi:hypothetical protein
MGKKLRRGRSSKVLETDRPLRISRLCELCVRSVISIASQ